MRRERDLLSSMVISSLFRRHFHAKVICTDCSHCGVMPMGLWGTECRAIQYMSCSWTGLEGGISTGMEDGILTGLVNGISAGHSFSQIIFCFLILYQDGR